MSKVKPSHRWWLRMLAASAALVALLLAAAALGPAAPLHYHAWRYRKYERREDFRAAFAIARARGLSPGAVRRLLGRPEEEARRKDGVLVLCYCHWDPSSWFETSSSFYDPFREVGDKLFFRAGRLVGTEPLLEGEHLEADGWESLEPVEPGEILELEGSGGH